MKQGHLSAKKNHWISVTLLVVMVFLSFGKPIFAADTMMDVTLMEGHQGVISPTGETHSLFENDSILLIRSNTAPSGYTMICCINGEKPMSPAQQTSLKLVKELEVSLHGENTLCEEVNPLFVENTLPAGEITLLANCQRE